MNRRRKGTAAAPRRAEDEEEADYDTMSSASMSSTTGQATVMFHGLLNNADASKLSLGARDTTGQRIATHFLRETDSYASDADDSPVTPSMCQGDAMTMPYTILVAPPLKDGLAKKTVESAIEAVFARANDTLNSWNSNSELSKLLSRPVGKKTEISKDLTLLFDKIDNVHALTKGRFDPTASVFNLAWSRSLKEHGRPPKPSEVKHLRHSVGWPTRIRRKTPAVLERMNGNTIIDVDGIAKGHVVDLLLERVVEVLVENGISEPSVYVDWAGDIRATGQHPTGRPWRAGIMNPPKLPSLFKAWAEGTLDSCLKDAEASCVSEMRPSDAGGTSQIPTASSIALATSGDYVQIQKYGYHHIVDPGSMKVMKAGASSVASVSVLSATCAVADAVATAAMTFRSSTEASAFLNELAARPDKTVLGYCVMGRTESGEPTVTMSSFFDERSSRTVQDSESTADEPSVLASEQRELVVTRCARVPYTLSTPSMATGVLVDSLTTVAIEPEPVVSFFVHEKEFSDFQRARKDEAMRLTLGTKEEVEKRNGFVDVRVTRNFKTNSDHLLVLATVSGASQGTADSVAVSYASKVLAHPLPKPMETTVFSDLDPASKARAFFRRVPSLVWVLVTASASGDMHALTASSVASPTSAPDILSFNVMESNVFHEAIAGRGSSVRAYALDASLQSLADKFTASSTPTPEDKAALEEKCTVAIRMSVTETMRVADHMVVVGTVWTASAAPRTPTALKPVVWFNRAYAALSPI